MIAILTCLMSCMAHIWEPQKHTTIRKLLENQKEIKRVSTPRFFEITTKQMINLPNGNISPNQDFTQQNLKLNQPVQKNGQAGLRKDAKNDWSEGGANNNSETQMQLQAPNQTFSKTPFNELMGKFEAVGNQIQPTLELTQAMLMTTNLKETAANVEGMQITTNGPTGSFLQTSSTSNGKVGSAPDVTASGGTYFYKQDYMSDLSKKCASKDFAQVSKILTNMGTSDKATNWLLEQRTLQRAHANEGKEIRNMIDDKIVDSTEYLRIKENIALAKIRANKQFSSEILSDGNSSETEEDSGQAAKNKIFSDRKINGIIKNIRSNAKQYLGDGKNYDRLPLNTVCKMLRKEPNFVRRRDEKALLHGISKQTSHLKEELSDLKQITYNKKEINQKIKQIESVLDLEKRLKIDSIEKTIAEIDMKPMDTQAFDIQNVLFDYCRVNVNSCYQDQSQDHNNFANQKRIERLFGKIRRLPKKSCMFNNFDQNLFTKTVPVVKEPVKKQALELVKVIGLEPEKLFEKIPKYKIQISKMPQFSNTFDSVDSVIPGLSMKNSLAGQSIINPLTSQMNFQRIDGRQVISLQFNPYFISNDFEKKKIYDGYMKDIIEQRDKIKNAPKEAKNKQETQNIKRAWMNIVKKDIPKAFRMYQKFKADQESNNKKLSQNCLKEVRKKAVRTQRLARESVMRARKLTREMQNYWRKRDKEQADSKRKREKMDKEMKKRQQEEEEALLQKKRLEYLMSQSEIYSHFMANKLGVNEELEKKKNENGSVQKSALMKKVDIDRRAARINVASMINENRQRLDDFDDHDREEVNEEDLDEVNLQNPQMNTKVQKPNIFRGDLKEYQLKGLQWLDNLYDQGINGILADEMGLGKTIQTIALLSHLAEKKNVWGPFLIIVPVTTLHNWQNELAKFCPELKVLPYFGSAEERKKLAKFLDPKNLYNPAMCIHVLITSYNLMVGGGKDQLRLQRVKWHYMILDEAQAIKNNLSKRWKTLLGFQTRNRLLLSGTPIQNSMAELWALLHFIMPKLFDNHEQFQEWFSKDIEQHSMDQGELNKHQLKRLHLILQPFMLRRLKKDVEQEIAPKIEETIHCVMTHRQKVLYDRIKSKISVSDLFQLSSNKTKMENLMNLVMQFRKVCNHPDLFERRFGKNPFCFSKMQCGMNQNLSLLSKPEVIVSNHSPITFNLPKMIYDECFLVSDNNTKVFSKLKKGLDVSFSNVSVENHFQFFNIFNELNLYQSIYAPKSAFSIIGLLHQSNNFSFSDTVYLSVADKMMTTISLLHYYSQKFHQNTYRYIHNSNQDSIEHPFGSFGMVYNDRSGFNKSKLDIIVQNFGYRDNSFIYQEQVVENLDLQVPGFWIILKPLIPEHPKEFLSYNGALDKMFNIYFENATASPIEFSCPSTSFQRYQNTILDNPLAKKVMIGQDFKPKRNIYIGRVGRERSSFLTQDGHKQGQTRFDQGPPNGYSLIDNGILASDYDVKGSCSFQLPDYSRLVTDCSKMKILADLLDEKHKNGNRCLVFCQMTKMMDILEDFLIWRKFSYFRMDGSTQLQDRRFMVEEFQNNNNVFVFILSTRAGGLGINLIAADTVIFYDNDWNPTMDSQATDRAHRIGQKKTVHVYRLVTKSSVEERILRRARQKESVQSTVYGANLKADSFSTRDVVDMIIDDIDDPFSNVGANRNQVKGFIKTGGAQKEKKVRKKKKKNGETEEIVYETVAKLDKHKKYENEIDLLLNEEGSKNEIQPDEAAAEASEEEQSDFEEDPTTSYPQTAQEKKLFLLKMLEKQSGGARQIFNFEEEDNPGQLKPNGVAEAPAAGDNKIQRSQRGRPKKDMEGPQEIEDDEIMDEEDY